MAEPRLIKRYANRKLYDTKAKRYVTLRHVAELVREGEEIRVVENDTGADLTSVTLSQILVDQEKKRTGRLPQGFLTELVKSSSTLFEQLRRTVTSWVHTADLSREDLERHLQQLVEKGQLTLEEAARIRDEVGRRADTIVQLLDRRLEASVRTVIGRLGLVERSELSSLTERLRALEQRVDRALAAGSAQAPDAGD